MKENISIPDCFYKEEVKDGYYISSKMKHIWAVQLDILWQIIKICEKHNIKYFAIGGTLLGTVRHKGYIPWDDDLDIAMYREDYDRFCEIAPKELVEPYFFQTEATDPGYLLRHAKVRNSRTTGILTVQKEKKYSFNQGIFVDIFPIDKLPDDLHERELFFEELYKTWGDVYKYSAFLNRQEQLLSGYLGDFSEDRNTLCEYSKMKNNSFEILSGKYKNNSTKESCIIALTVLPNKINNNWIWQDDDLKDIEYHFFEFFKIPIPRRYDNILTKTYGNWREFVIANSLHGDVIFDVEQSYKNYVNKD